MIREEISIEEKSLLEKYGKEVFDYSKIVQDGSLYFLEFDDYDDFSTGLTFDIIHFGMDNQDVVNEVGRELYAIHDRIYYE